MSKIQVLLQDTLNQGPSNQTQTQRSAYGKVKNHPSLVKQLRTQKISKDKRLDKADINNSQVLDLVQTGLSLQKAKDIISGVLEKKGSILFVGTQHPMDQFLINMSKSYPIHYVYTKWVVGMLTNWKMLSRAIRRFHTLEFLSKDGYSETISPQDAMKLKKQKIRLEKYLGGIKYLKGLPQLVILFTPSEIDNVVLECKKFGIPVIGVFDTYCGHKELTVYVPYTCEIKSEPMTSWVINELFDSFKEYMGDDSSTLSKDGSGIMGLQGDNAMGDKSRRGPRKKNPRRKLI